jgi:hypothetical protein
LMEILENTGQARPYPMLSVMPRPRRSNFPPPVKIVGFDDPDKSNLEVQALGHSEEISLSSLFEERSEPKNNPPTPVVSQSDYPTLDLWSAASSNRRQLNSLLAAVVGAYTSSVRRYWNQQAIRGRDLLIALSKKTAELFKGRYRTWAIAGTVLAFILVGGGLFALLQSNARVAAKPAAVDGTTRKAPVSTPETVETGRSLSGNMPETERVTPGNDLLPPLVTQRYTLIPSQPSTRRTFVLDPSLAPIPATTRQNNPTVTKPSVPQRNRSTRTSRKNKKNASLILRHPDF